MTNQELANRMRNNGVTCTTIAKVFGVSVTTASNWTNPESREWQRFKRKERLAPSKLFHVSL